MSDPRNSEVSLGAVRTATPGYLADPGGTPVELLEVVRDVDIRTIELELFREFERLELRRLESRRGQPARPRTTTGGDGGRR